MPIQCRRHTIVTNPVAERAVAAPGLLPERLMELTFGFAPPLMIEAAIRHRIFDVLEGGPRTIEELCARTGTASRGLRAVLNALVGLALLSKDKEGRYALTAESATFLVSGKPSFHGAFFLLTKEPMLVSRGKLDEVVRDGRPARRINMEQDDAKFFLQFVESLFPIHYPAARQLAEALNVAAATAPLSVLDVAAGSGVWSVALAQQSDHVRVTAVDWPSVMAVTQKVAAQNALLDRYTFIAGDLLDVDFGRGHQIATLGHILHSEGDERNRRLLKKCFDALTPGGTIAIAEILVDPERATALRALMFAVNMVVNSDHGGTFSLEEITEWLGDAGFANVRTAEAPGLAPRLILATKPNIS
jgi:2-polyprenyl-3-methyl-5-hydroxy-6-metoxy-1,4-benzoquinol methylase/DNA-binding transcriptional ArsR family regulator